MIVICKTPATPQALQRMETVQAATRRRPGKHGRVERGAQARRTTSPHQSAIPAAAVKMSSSWVKIENRIDRVKAQQPPGDRW
jgi:hypothetical protein